MRIQCPSILAAENLSANPWTLKWVQFLSGFLLLGLWGCASLPVPGVDLEDASRDYALRLRWSDYEGAARHMDESLQEEFLDRFRDQEDLHIVEVRPEAIRVEPPGSRAKVRMVVEFYNLPSLTVRKISFSQKWALVHGAGSGTPVWRIISPLPPFP